MLQGADGINAAVVRGALRAAQPDLLTVVLPQSLSKQSSELQALLAKVRIVIEMPENNDIKLKEAARLCNRKLMVLAEASAAAAPRTSRPRGRCAPCPVRARGCHASEPRRPCVHARAVSVRFRPVRVARALQNVIGITFHDSSALKQTIEEAREMRKQVAEFFLD